MFISIFQVYNSNKDSQTEGSKYGALIIFCSWGWGWALRSCYSRKEPPGGAVGLLGLPHFSQ